MTTIKTDYGFVLIGPCLICGTEITNEEGREIDCYNEECREFRKNFVAPEGWTITPFVKSFSSGGLKINIDINLKERKYSDEVLLHQQRNHWREYRNYLLSELEAETEDLSNGAIWNRMLLAGFLILIIAVAGFYIFKRFS